MRILHVINGLSVTRGGPSATLAALATAQARRGHQVVVLSSMRQPAPLTLQPGVQGNLSVFEADTELDSKWHNPHVVTEVRRHAHECDIVHIHGSWRCHLIAAAKVCREYGLPYICRPAGNLGVVSVGHKWYLKRPYFFLVERPIFNRASAIHCTSQSELDQVARLKLRPRTFVVPNAVAMAEREAKAANGAIRQLCPQLEPHHHVILYLGRITWIKNLGALVEAFLRVHRTFPDWRLVLAGTLEDAGIVRHLQSLAAAQGIADRLMLPGTVLSDAKGALYQRADVFAQPSLHENFGASVAEALCYGLPCLVSDGVALAPDVEEFGAGLVCPSNSEALAGALARLMGDEELRKQSGQQALRLPRVTSPKALLRS